MFDKEMAHLIGKLILCGLFLWVMVLGVKAMNEPTTSCEKKIEQIQAIID